MPDLSTIIFMNNLLPKKRFFPYKVGNMTIVAGFIAKDFITIASDSKMSYGGSSKRLDAKKLHSITFQDGTGMLVAQAGEVSITSRLIDLIRNRAALVPLVGEQPAKIAEQVLREVKNEMLGPVDPNRNKINDLDELCKRHDASLMFGYFYEQEPYLFTLDFSQPISFRHKDYATLGCGGSVADFILSWIDPSTIDWVDATPWAIYIIEQVKKVDSNCEGPTNVGCVTMPRFKSDGSWVGTLPRENIEMMAAELESHDLAAKRRWKTSLVEVISAASKKLNAQQDTKYQPGSFIPRVHGLPKLTEHSPISPPHPSAQSSASEPSTEPPL